MDRSVCFCLSPSPVQSRRSFFFLFFESAPSTSISACRDAVAYREPFCLPKPKPKPKENRLGEEPVFELPSHEKAVIFSPIDSHNFSSTLPRRRPPSSCSQGKAFAGRTQQKKVKILKAPKFDLGKLMEKIQRNLGLILQKKRS
ncbi:hypothetical protein K1719_010155 [Acacia pycnantha]|nr:hypothetical protein K1719_010155 [Acacia pycnantha]